MGAIFELENVENNLAYGLRLRGQRDCQDQVWGSRSCTAPRRAAWPIAWG